MHWRTKTTLVGIKLTPAELSAVDDLVKLRYESRSAVLRAGLQLLFDAAKLKFEHAQKIRTERIIHRPRRRQSLKDGEKP